MASSTFYTFIVVIVITIGVTGSAAAFRYNDYYWSALSQGLGPSVDTFRWRTAPNYFHLPLAPDYGLWALHNRYPYAYNFYHYDYPQPQSQLGFSSQLGQHPNISPTTRLQPPRVPSISRPLQTESVETVDSKEEESPIQSRLQVVQPRPKGPESASTILFSQSDPPSCPPSRRWDSRLQKCVSRRGET